MRGPHEGHTSHPDDDANGRSQDDRVEASAIVTGLIKTGQGDVLRHCPSAVIAESRLYRHSDFVSQGGRVPRILRPLHQRLVFAQCSLTPAPCASFELVHPPTIARTKSAGSFILARQGQDWSRLVKTGQDSSGLVKLPLSPPASGVRISHAVVLARAGEHFGSRSYLARKESGVVWPVPCQNTISFYLEDDRMKESEKGEK